LDKYSSDDWIFKSLLFTLFLTLYLNPFFNSIS
jgi:hypothetical protein